ncbi:calcium/proton exchanger [Pleurotus eryngii]|uniref:Calcium/proton exchanger n=1 Tax=Pleurotus eryngii TaxID=5323 RepID=A0A9P6D8B6_PLEER|nr:calcium/proton exchanger [Pleurotus eryngii]
MTPVNEEPDDVVQHTASGRQQPLQSKLSHRQRAGSLPKSNPTETEGVAMARSSTRNLFRAASMLLIPDKKVGPAPSVLDSLRSILFASWLNVLLVFIPVSWALNFAMKDEHTLIFVFSFLAIIPLAKLLAFATDELSMRVGQTLAGLLNATLGNAVELIVAILALVKCQLTIVQSSLIGSILSNLLLVLGMCFFAGGTQYSEQGFTVSTVQLNSSLLTISVIAVLLPAAYILALSEGPADPNQQQGKQVLQLSRGVAIILLFIYGSYLVFQLWSHAGLYDETSDAVIKSQPYARKSKDSKRKSLKDEPRSDDATDSHTSSSRTATVNGDSSMLPSQNTIVPSANGSQRDLENGNGQIGNASKEEEEEKPQLSVWMTVGLLVVVTVLVAVTAEWLVDSIDGLTEGGTISKEFVGVILLPIVGNAAEHVTAVTVSIKDKLTLSLGVAVGSSIQIALFVIPFIVTLGWILGKPLTLLFDPYESISLFLAVLTVNYVVQDGKSNWLEGMILMCLYLILGVTFWFYPGAPSLGILPQCT